MNRSCKPNADIARGARPPRAQFFAPSRKTLCPLASTASCQVGRPATAGCAPSDAGRPTAPFTTLTAGGGLPALPLRQPTSVSAKRPGVRPSPGAASSAHQPPPYSYAPADHSPSPQGEGRGEGERIAPVANQLSAPQSAVHAPERGVYAASTSDDLPPTNLI